MYGGVCLTEEAKQVLFEGKMVTMLVRPEDKKKPAPAPAPVGEEAGKLYDVLKNLRWKIAQKEHVPVYIIFSNATLEDMAAKRPRTMEEFRSVNGVGSVKAQRYGQLFLDAIAEYRGT